MNVPPVESFEQSLPDRQAADQERQERESSAQQQAREPKDRIRISPRARSMANEAIFIDTVLGRLVRRFASESELTAASWSEPESAELATPIGRLAAATPPRPVTPPLPADRAARRVLIGIATLVEHLEDDSRPKIERDEFRIDISHELEDALADARRVLLESDALDEELTSCIEEAQTRVRTGLEILFARRADTPS